MLEAVDQFSFRKHANEQQKTKCRTLVHHTQELGATITDNAPVKQGTGVAQQLSCLESGTSLHEQVTQRTF